MLVLETIGLAALGWVASPIVTKLLNEGFASLGINMEERLEMLEITILLVFEAVIKEAEGSEHRNKVIKWLQRLKDAYDDAEDELDLLNYRRLERKVKAAACRTSNRPTIRVRSLFQSCRVPRSVRCTVRVGKGCRNMLSPRKISLRCRLNKLEKIANEAEKLRALLGLQTKTALPSDSRQTVSQPPRKVFGRDEDCEKIIRLLKMEPPAISEPGSADIPIIAIVGRAGVGKTTLAQCIYNQLESEGEKHFDLLMLVDASRNFELDKIMQNIIQQAFTAADLPTTETAAVSKIASHQVLQQTMVKKLEPKKFLLMIDDVQCNGEDHMHNWDTLLRCLSKCLPGSKILVTSQTNDAPRKIGATTENIHPLKELEENDFLNLFFHHALPSREIDSRLGEDLEEIGKKIASKLNEDPTAAKLVGLCLRDNLEVRYWRDAEQKDWSGDRTKALMWSYQHLPAHLQRCFSYCSLYPKGYQFKALQLAQLWMAQGFIETDDQNKRMEDVGKQYLEELVSRFYIRHYHGGCSLLTGEALDWYILPQLQYDLAERVSSNVCLRIEGNHHQTIPSTIRHLYISANKLNECKKDICKLTKLRTLIVVDGESIASENVTTDIFKSLKKLRVLLLELNLGNSAQFICEMRQLRILGVSSTSKSVLHESMCTLYQLQVLRVENASSLPERLNNLVSLRYLEPDFDLVPRIPDIGRLTSLQGLTNFEVRKEKGFGLDQLQNLNELRGCLRISNLENVGSKEIAIAANLKEKKYLDKLLLLWNDDREYVDSNLEAEILEALQLPPKVTSLSMFRNRGRSYPSWPEDQTSNIESLQLMWCSMLEELPPMDKSYPSCRALVLNGLYRLKALHILPQKLTRFKLVNAPFLTFVTKEELQMNQDKKRCIIEVIRKRSPIFILFLGRRELVDDERQMMYFIDTMSVRTDTNIAPASTEDEDHTERWLRLHERKMELIYNLQNEAKLHLPSTLTELWLEKCNVTNHALSECLQNLTSLTRLTLRQIRSITRLPFEEVLCELKALQHIVLARCWCLTSLGGIESLPRLRQLHLEESPCLENRTTFLPSSLASVTIIRCADVDDILADADLPCLSYLSIDECSLRTASLQLGGLRSLRSLQIWRCRKLSSLVDMQELHSLELLNLRHCPNLQAATNLLRLPRRSIIRNCPNFRLVCRT